jgi:hypothetical protein
VRLTKSSVVFVSLVLVFLAICPETLGATARRRKVGFFATCFLSFIGLHGSSEEAAAQFYPAPAPFSPRFYPAPVGPLPEFFIGPDGNLYRTLPPPELFVPPRLLGATISSTGVVAREVPFGSFPYPVTYSTGPVAAPPSGSVVYSVGDPVSVTVAPSVSTVKVSAAPATEVMVVRSAPKPASSTPVVPVSPKERTGPSVTESPPRVVTIGSVSVTGFPEKWETTSIGFAVVLSSDLPNDTQFFHNGKLLRQDEGKKVRIFNLYDNVPPGVYWMELIMRWRDPTGQLHLSKFSAYLEPGDPSTGWHAEEARP